MRAAYWLLVIFTAPYFFLVSPKPDLGIRSTVVVFGRLAASFTGMNSPVFESLPRGKVFVLLTLATD